MTDDERRLLLAVSRSLADLLDKEGAMVGQKDHLAAEMWRLIAAIDPDKPRK